MKFVILLCKKKQSILIRSYISNHKLWWDRRDHNEKKVWKVYNKIISKRESGREKNTILIREQRISYYIMKKAYIIFWEKCYSTNR